MVRDSETGEWGLFSESGAISEYPYNPGIGPYQGDKEDVPLAAVPETSPFACVLMGLVFLIGKNMRQFV